MDFDYSNDTEKDEFESIPLPDQMPQKVIVSETQSLKSRTVQTLLNQNQDLMARLTVALKRNIDLDQKIEDQEEQYKSLKVQSESIKDQYSVQFEKTKRIEFEMNKLVEENSVLENRHAELYTTFQDKINYIQTLSYKLHKYINYRKRIRGYVRPFIQNLKYQIEHLIKETLILKDELLKKNEIIRELKSKLEEAFDHIQVVTANFEKDQLQLVDYHEKRFFDVSSQKNELEKNNSILIEKNSELKSRVDELSENEASLQNKSIYFERKFSDLEAEYNSLYQEHSNQKRNDTQKIQFLESQVAELSKQLSETSNVAITLKSENQTMMDQLQSLQLLYQDNHQKQEDLKKMLSAQEQMNKDLSYALSEQRKKSEHFEQKFLETEEEFKRKLQSFQMRFYKKPDDAQITAGTTPVVGQKELLDRIQNLLSEIQTGQPTPLANQPQQLVSETGEIES